MFAGQPAPGTRPSLCPELQEEKIRLTTWGVKHLILVSQRVARKLIGRRPGRPSGVGAAGKAVASGGGRFGNERSVGANSVLGSRILITSWNPKSGRGEARIKGSHYNLEVHVFTPPSWCL